MRLGRGVRLPTRADDWRLVLTAVTRVLSRPRYVVVGLAGAWVALTAISVSRNVELFVRVVLGGSLPVENRAAVLAGMYPFGSPDFVGVAAAAVVGLALLLGLDVAMIAYHVGEHGASLAMGAGGSAGTTGAVLAGLGAGCVVCGVSALAGVLSFLGVAGGAVVLPFEGVAFSLVAAGLVLVSVFWTAEGMHGGMRRREVVE